MGAAAIAQLLKAFVLTANSYPKVVGSNPGTSNRCEFRYSAKPTGVSLPVNQKWPNATTHPTQTMVAQQKCPDMRQLQGAPQCGWQTRSAEEAGGGRERAKKVEISTEN